MSKYQNLSLAEQFAELHTDTSKALADLATQLTEQTKISRRNTQLLEALLGIELDEGAAGEGPDAVASVGGAGDSGQQQPTFAMGRFAEQSEQQQQALMEHLTVLAGKMDIASGFSTAGGYAIVLLDGYLYAIREQEWRLAAFLNYRGYPEPGTLTFLRGQVEPGQKVIDVGAGYGILTVPVARLVEPGGKVWAVEADPEVRVALEGNVKVNGFAEKGIVTVIPVAASDKDGQATLYIHPADSGQNSLIPTDGATQISVEAVKLDDYLSEITAVDWAIIDVGGAEPNVLRGMSRIITESPRIGIILKWQPGKLLNAGVDVNAWLGELRAQFTIQAIKEEDGETWPVSDQELLGIGSVNLLLRPISASAAAATEVSVAE